MGTLGQRIAEIQAGIGRVAQRHGGLSLDGALLFRLLVLVGRELSTVLEDLLREHGLNDAEFRTLMMLYSQPDGVAYPTDLCLCVSQSPANMTRIADGLLQRELITRTPSDEDRRRTLLRITAPGEALVRELMPKSTARTHALFGHLSAAERQQLEHLLQDVCARLDALPERTAWRTA